MTKPPNEPAAPPVGFHFEKVKLTLTIEAEVVFPLGTDAQTMIQWVLDRVSFAVPLASCVRRAHVRPFPIGIVSS